MKRNKKRSIQSNQETATPVSANGSSISSGSGYTAADNSSSRGYIYWPYSNGKRAVPSYVRKEIASRANWLCANVGLARHFANTIPRLAGPLQPEPATNDPKWNDLAHKFFLATQGSRMIHDEAGMESFFTRQRTILKRMLIDGDCFLALTTTATGNARTVFYEGNQIGNFHGTKMNDGWIDGVKVNAYGKRTHYCILTTDELTLSKGEIVSASKVLHCGRFESPSSPRGVSGFVHAVPRLMDIREIDNDTMKGIKAANLWGLVVTNQTLSNVDVAPAGGKFVSNTDATARYRGIDRPNVAAPARIKTEEIFDGAGGAIATLNQGQDAKVIQDSRRHPNQQAVLDYFIHDIAAGFSFPYEAIWAIQGISGPAVRFVMRMAEKTLGEMREGLIEQFCQPFYNYTIALAIKNGQLPVPKDPEWWQCKWVAPAALTIDVGRDSAAGMRELEEGGTTYQEWYAEDGKNWKKVFDDRGAAVAEAQKVAEKYGVDVATIIKMPEKQPIENPAQNPTQTGQK